MYQNARITLPEISFIVSSVRYCRPQGGVGAECEIRTILQIQLVLYYPRIAQAEGEHNRYRMKNVHGLTIS